MTRRNILILCACLAAVVLVAGAAFFLTRPLTIRHLTTHRAWYDGKTVTTHGLAVDVRKRVSRAGNPYYTFVLKEGYYQKGKVFDNPFPVSLVNAATVNVFSFGDTPPKEGSEVKVSGTYAKIKAVGRLAYTNEIDATEGSISPVK